MNTLSQIFISFRYHSFHSNIFQKVLTHYSPVLLIYTPLKTSVFRGYRSVTLGCNEFKGNSYIWWQKNINILFCICFSFTPANKHLLKVKNRNIRKKCEYCSKLTIKTRKWRHSGVFIVNFEYNSHHFLMFLYVTLLTWYQSATEINFSLSLPSRHNRFQIYK